jgi:hypothetical protein
MPVAAARASRLVAGEPDWSSFGIGIGIGIGRAHATSDKLTFWHPQAWSSLRMPSAILGLGVRQSKVDRGWSFSGSARAEAASATRMVMSIARGRRWYRRSWCRMREKRGFRHFEDRHQDCDPRRSWLASGDQAG